MKIQDPIITGLINCELVVVDLNMRTSVNTRTGGVTPFLIISRNAKILPSLDPTNFTRCSIDLTVAFFAPIVTAKCRKFVWKFGEQ